MKVKYALLFFSTGLVLTIIGALLRIMHYTNSYLFLSAGLLLELVGGIIIIFKLIKNSRSKDFLNS